MDKQILKKLDEFLAAFDVEELIKDGVNLVKFRYDKDGKTCNKTYIINENKELEEKKC